MEAGWFVGKNLPLHIYSPDPGEPDNAHIMATSYQTEIRGLVDVISGEVSWRKLDDSNSYVEWEKGRSHASPPL